MARAADLITTRRDRSDVAGLPHGTPSCYSNYRCSCEDCKRAWTDYILSRRKAKASRVKAASNCCGATVERKKCTRCGDYA